MPATSEARSSVRLTAPRFAQVRRSVMLMSRSIDRGQHLGARLDAEPRADPLLVGGERELREQVARLAFADEPGEVEVAERVVVGQRGVAGAVELDAYHVGPDRIDRAANVIGAARRHVRRPDDVVRRIAADQQGDGGGQVHADRIPRGGATSRHGANPGGFSFSPCQPPLAARSALRLDLASPGGVRDSLWERPKGFSPLPAAVGGSIRFAARPGFARWRSRPALGTSKGFLGHGGGAGGRSISRARSRSTTARPPGRSVFAEMAAHIDAT
jgi:hypothetical protein